MGDRLRGVLADWRALALAACTLWGNMLILDAQGASAAAPLLTRTSSMAFGLVGMVAAFLVAARTGSALPRRWVTIASGTVACLGTLAHDAGLSTVSPAADAVVVAAFSVAFGFLVVGCGEVYAGMTPRRSLAYASASYFVAWAGCAVVRALPDMAVCAVAALLPVVVTAMLPALPIPPASTGAAAESKALAGTPSSGKSILAALRGSLRAIPPRVLAALFITYLAIGSTLATASDPAGFFSPVSVTFAALTSLVCLGAGVALCGRVRVVSFCKAAIVIQVLGILLFGQWTSAAMLVSVICLVGVNIVTWTLQAECAHDAATRGLAPAACVFALGQLVMHLGESASSMLIIAQVVDRQAFSLMILLLLVIAAAFLFTGPTGETATEGAGASPSAGGESGRGAEAVAGSGLDSSEPGALAAEALEARILQVAQTYQLSDRETDVFRLWATGHSLKYIQDRLALSQSTVKTHVRHIYAKTNRHSRAEVVALLDDE